jgi:hypothetical protein
MMVVTRVVRTSVLAVTAAVATVTSALAQTQSTPATSDTYGVKGGVVLSTLDLTIPNFITSPDQQIGLTAGAFVGRRFPGRIHLDVEALVTTKGASYNLGEDLENLLTLTYLEVPVLARAAVFRSVYVSGGPYFAFKLKEVHEEDGEEIGINDEVKKSDFGVAFGGGVVFGRLVFDARYSLGLIDIVDVDTGGFAEPTAKTRALSLTVGYRF